MAGVGKCFPPYRIFTIARYSIYQNLREEEAFQVALSESLHMYQCDVEEEEELALAIQMSLATHGQEAQIGYCHSGTFLGVI